MIVILEFFSNSCIFRSEYFCSDIFGVEYDETEIWFLQV